jgi:hypothetical protein
MRMAGSGRGWDYDGKPHCREVATMWGVLSEPWRRPGHSAGATFSGRPKIDKKPSVKSTMEFTHFA